MASRRLQLEGPSLAELKARVLAEHGPHARIIAAEKVTVGGIRGFFARQHYEVTVEIPGDPEALPAGARRRAAAGSPAGQADSHVLDVPARTGIAALLAEAEKAEERLLGTPGLHVSTGSGDFAELMDELTFNTAPPVPEIVAPGPMAPSASGPTAVARAGIPGPTAVPVPLAGAGDLVLIVGLGDDPLQVARSMAAARGADVRAAGALAAAGTQPVQDRRSATAARAAAVAGGHAVVVGYGLGRNLQEATGHVAALAGIGADQLWVAVDAGRKPEDTALWVGAVHAVARVDALAVTGSDGTASPATVNGLGVPAGWVDGAPAAAPVL